MRIFVNVFQSVLYIIAVISAIKMTPQMLEKKPRKAEKIKKAITIERRKPHGGI